LSDAIPTVVLVHGAFADASTWNGVITRLQAASFDNPDHVAIAIHNYRWRLGLSKGEAQYDELEKRLAEGPVITVPAITLEGDANGAPHPEPSAYATKFTGTYSHRTIEGAIGHNLPPDAPEPFADAVLEVAGAK
jgi:pimeloyl-ACP methyl ester carboxylesterase